MKLLSRAFRSVKFPNPNPNPNPSKSSLSPSKPPSSIPISKTAQSNSKSRRSWCVYLILSTNTHIKTYVGVTTDFTRRLKQHNGEVKGGAKSGKVCQGNCPVKGRMMTWEITLTMVHFHCCNTGKQLLIKLKDRLIAVA